MATYVPYGTPLPAQYGATPLAYELPRRSAMRQDTAFVPEIIDFAPDKKDKKAKEKIETELFAFEIQREGETYATSRRREIKLSQANLEEMIQPAVKKDSKQKDSKQRDSQQTPVKVFWGLQENKRRQVDALLDKMADEEKNPDAQWSLAHIHKQKDRQGKTLYVLVILRRHGKEKADKVDKVKEGDGKASKEGKPGKDKKSESTNARGEFVDLNNLPTKSKKEKGDNKTKDKQPPADVEGYTSDHVYDTEVPLVSPQAPPPPPTFVPAYNQSAYQTPRVPPPLPLETRGPVPLPTTPIYSEYLPQRPKAYATPRPPSPFRRDSLNAGIHSPGYSNHPLPHEGSSTESSYSDNTDFTIPSLGNDKRPHHGRRYTEDFTRVARRNDERMYERRDKDYRDDRRGGYHRSISPKPRRRTPSPVEDRRRQFSPPPRERYDDRARGRHSPEREDYRRSESRQYEPRSYDARPYDNGRRSGPNSAHDSKRSDGQRSRISDAEKRKFDKWGDEIVEEERNEWQRETFKEGFKRGKEMAEGRGR
ncbi:Hypothetical protein D9617_6g095810 [Elsinoe fawcettii]|nr:Hypothetical protein D9617_6g095810 [Elsinoe fawcettii]